MNPAEEVPSPVQLHPPRSEASMVVNNGEAAQMGQIPPEVMQMMRDNTLAHASHAEEPQTAPHPVSQEEEQLLNYAKAHESTHNVGDGLTAEQNDGRESPASSPQDELANAQREMQLLAQAMAEKENSPHGADSILPPSPSDSDVSISPSLIKQTGDKPFIMRAISGIYTGLREAVSKLLHSPWQWTKDQINAFADRIFAKKQPAVFSKYSAAALKEAANGSLSFKAQSDSVSFQPKSNSVSFQRNAPPMAA